MLGAFSDNAALKKSNSKLMKSVSNLKQFQIKKVQDVKNLQVDTRPSLSTKSKLKKLEQKQGPVLVNVNKNLVPAVAYDLNEKSSLSFSDDFSTSKRARPESYRDNGNIVAENKIIKAYGEKATR